MLTQGKVGRWLGLTQGQISRLECAPKPVFDLEKLEQWARALAIPERHLWFRLSAQSPATYSASSGGPTVHPDAEGDEVRRRELFKAAGIGLATTGFGWFGPGIASAGTRRRIGSADVASVREMTRSFRRLDNRYGGGHARATVCEYLASNVAPLLRNSRSSDPVRADLYGAVAELNQLAGWMAYDVGDSETGSKHLRQALRLCQEVDDDSLAAEMLAGMSHQAAFFRSGSIAADLAEAARARAVQSGVAALVSEASVMAAHGYALQGHSRACLAALGDAERALALAETRDTPEWLAYFDAAYLSAKFAHCFRDLGRPMDAEKHARRSLEMIEGYDRGRLFNLSVLAAALADQSQVDEACAVASDALDAAGSIQSVRTVAYLADVGQRLNRYRQVPSVQMLYGRMTTAGIPLPAA